MINVVYTLSPHNTGIGPEANEPLDFELKRLTKEDQDRYGQGFREYTAKVYGWKKFDAEQAFMKIQLKLPAFYQSGGFESLTRLTILNMHGNMNYWLAWLLDVLVGSPSLEHLSLSISGETMINRERLPTPDIQPCRSFFLDLCQAYGKKVARPMKLRSLRLGESIQFPARSTLSVLTDTKYLEELYMCTQYENLYLMILCTPNQFLAESRPCPLTLRGYRLTYSRLLPHQH